MSIDYLESAKNYLAQCEGNHATDYIKTFALFAIANALIAIAEGVTK